MQQFEHSLALLFFGIVLKTDLLQSVATAEFSKFADILSATLLQHHLLGFAEGDQPWDFFGRNDAKAETPVLWPPHAKS